VGASNGQDPNAIQTFNIDVVDTGVPPEITSTEVTEATVDQLYTYVVEADGAPAPIFSLTDPPQGMIIDPVSGLIQWTPDASQFGLNSVTVVARNGQSPDATQDFTINVAGISPVIISTAVTEAVVGQPYTYQLQSTGVPAPTYSWDTVQLGMTVNSVTGLIEWTPEASQIGPNAVTVVASNGQVPDANQIFVINVAADEIAPEIISSPPTTATIRQLYSYDADAEGFPTPTYSLMVSPSGMTINSASGLIQWTPDASQLGSHAVTVVASNGPDSQDNQEFSINIGEPPVYFADPNLKLAVETELGIIDPNPTDMLALGLLDAQNKAITNLIGIEYALNLTNLNIQQNQIIDLSPLSGLMNLTFLDVSDNQIINIDPLSQFSNLIYLNLTDNPLGRSAYCTHLPTIINANPGIDLRYDPSPYTARPGDADGDCDVDFVDFSILSNHWLEVDCGLCGGADFKVDNNIDQFDLEILMDNWLQADICDGDADGDCDVDFVDYSILSSHWLETGCGDCGGADLTGDNNVDLTDLEVLGLNWLANL
ncbi:MAG: putative Ig domain-containing protein, partial [Planctomycetota bacterium]|jgi:hypothetical protein